MARPTMSFSLFCQQFGRALRLMLPDGVAATWGDLTDAQRVAGIAASSKPFAIIIDHVSNTIRHGLPDAYREWSLDRGERKTRGRPSDVIPVRRCEAPLCLRVYERIHRVCPYCGEPPTVADRSAPDNVDGDLMELDPTVLAALRGEIARIDGAPMVPRHLIGTPAQIAILNKHADRKNAQDALRAQIALWAGYQRHLGRSDTETYRRFFFMFGTDIGTAQTLGAAEATELAERIAGVLAADRVISA